MTDIYHTRMVGLFRLFRINEYDMFLTLSFIFQKQCFDEKMEMMDEVFKSELITIKEQHERLREDLHGSKTA